MRRLLGLAGLILLVTTVTAKAVCSASALPVQFGTYNPSSDTTSTGAVAVQRYVSTPNCSYYITLSKGSSPSYTPRYMTVNGSNLVYQLYSDAGRSVVWSNGTAVADSSVPSGGSISHTVYARILAGQYLAPGTYTDTIIASAIGSGVQSPNATINVSATIAATCLISATNLAFGNYAGTQLDATATITVNCTNTTPYNVGLDAGTATGATVTTRKMKSGASLLSYALFSDPGRTTNWGSIAAQGVAGTGGGSNQAITVYGRVATGQNAAPGAYADAIIATITY